MVPHQYTDASDARDQYDADQVNRQAVTPQFAWGNLCDEPLFLHRGDICSVGLDPWVLVTGMDRDTKTGEFIVEFGRDGEVRMKEGEYLFAQRSTLRKLGLPEGTPGGPNAAH